MVGVVCTVVVFVAMALVIAIAVNPIRQNVFIFIDRSLCTLVAGRWDCERPVTFPNNIMSYYLKLNTVVSSL